MSDVTLIFEEQPISLAMTTATPINLVLDGGATYTAGTGIDISGTVISNTAPNVVQTLSIAGQDLTLSGGGGTVEIPGGSSLGTGFTAGGGTGTIPSGTVAALDGSIRYSIDAGQFTISDVTGNYYDLRLIVNPNFIQFGTGIGDTYTYVLDPDSQRQAFVSPGGQFEMGPTYTTYSDYASGLGITYAADYSATIAANPRSIPDVGTVDLLKQTPVSYTNAAAPNNCIFYSTTLSKLAYKDPGGTVNPLY